MIWPPNSNWPLRTPPCTTGEMTLPPCAPAHKNLKSDRLATPVPQLTNGPYSQLRASRTRATGLSSPGLGDGSLSGDSARQLRPETRNVAAKTNRKSFARGVKLLPSLVNFSGANRSRSIFRLSQKRPTLRSAFVAILGSRSAGDLFHLFGVHIEVRIDVLRI